MILMDRLAQAGGASLWYRLAEEIAIAVDKMEGVC